MFHRYVVGMFKGESDTMCVCKLYSTGVWWECLRVSLRL